MIRRCEFTAAILTCAAAILTSVAAAVPATSGGLSDVAAGFSSILKQRGGGTGSSQRLQCLYSAPECVTSVSGNVSCVPQPTEQIECRPDRSFNSDGYSYIFCKIFWSKGQVLKGCHTQLTNECSSSACVAGVGQSADSGFCCCNTSLCNSAYELPPPPPQSPPGSEPTGPPSPPSQPPPNSGRQQSQSETENGGGNRGRLLSPAVLIAVAVALVVLLLAVAWLYMRRRRTAMLLASAAAEAAAAAGAERTIDRHNRRAIPKDCCVGRRCALVATTADGDASTSARRDDSAELRRRVTPLLQLSEGRFCTVWKATMLSPARHGGGDKRGGRYAAAIKVVGRQHRRQWEAERDVYERLASALEQHANVASFIGAADCSDESGPASGLWIVTAYCERGSLYEYLQARTLSPTEACRIAHGAAAGLAFLHEHSSRLPVASAQQQQLVEISRAGCPNGCRSPDASVEAADLARQQWICGKPSIAHRDLKSANVLLTGDLTPRIVDFGLAAQFGQDDAPRGGGGFQFGPALQLVGTLRYMAPEMLEGAVEYTRDALLQCDVYSLGLVLWELLSRTSFAAFDNVEEAGAAVSAAAAAAANAAPPPPAPYEKPFERELGPQPTLAALQEAVAAHRLRPRAAPHWLRWRIGAQLFETAADCWDADAGARVTASCAEQRLRVLLDSLPPSRS